MPSVLSVNVGLPRPVETGQRTVLTAIWRSPVAGRVAVRGVNLGGDDQADRSVHGGPDKAVYAYAIEETREWEAELGRVLGPGAFGENLTTEGIEVSAAHRRALAHRDDAARGGPAAAAVLQARPAHGRPLVRQALVILLDHDVIPQVLEAPELLPSLREWMTAKIA